MGLFAGPHGAARKRFRTYGGYAVGILGVVVLVVVLLPFRKSLGTTNVAFIFLAIVVAATGLGGLGPGLATSVGGFLAYNFFFIHPYGTFAVAHGSDVVVLFMFLALAALVSTLLARARERAEAAEASRSELASLYDLARDLASATPGPRSYEFALRRLMARMGMKSAALTLTEPAGLRGLEGPLVVTSGGADDAARAVPVAESVLTVGSRALGVLRLSGDRGPLDPSEGRLLRGFSDQLALMLERDRLLAVAVKVNMRASGVEA